MGSYAFRAAPIAAQPDQGAVTTPIDPPRQPLLSPLPSSLPSNLILLAMFDEGGRGGKTAGRRGSGVTVEREGRH